jgi:KUP system potassium uptake protein
VVFPAILLCYFGQGAALLGDPRVVSHPFYALVPPPVHYPVVALATAATVIASQALIAGAFSLTQQAVQLGYLPRVTIRHTSPSMPGQIFVPEVNVALMVVCILLVLSFRESSRLAVAYGTAVAGAMATTTVLFFFVMRRLWSWSLLHAGIVGAGFLIVDLTFVGANLVKIVHGAWVPLAVAVIVYGLMSTWRRGLRLVAQGLAPVSVEALLHELERRPPARVPGVAVFLTAEPNTVPPELGHYLDRCRALHERVVLLVVSTAEAPRVPDRHRVTIRPLGQGLAQITVQYGFMESPDVPRTLARAEPWMRRIAPSDLTYFIGQVNLVRTRGGGWGGWRSGLFAFLWLLSRPQREHLRIPANQVVEVGMELELPA